MPREAAIGLRCEGGTLNQLLASSEHRIINTGDFARRPMVESVGCQFGCQTR